MLLTYPGGILSNVCPGRVANAIEREIRDLAVNYDKLIIIGHSAGAVLLRKAFLFSTPGVGADDPSDEAREAAATPQQFENVHDLAASASVDSRWWRKVDRFVFLAGVNGGWDRARVSWMSVLAFIGWAFNVGRFGRSIARGSPFIENLRIDWVRLQNHKGMQLPPVVLLEAETDNLLDDHVNRDVVARGVYHAITVDGSTHANIIAVGDVGAEATGLAKIRRRALIDALRIPVDEMEQNRTAAIRTRQFDGRMVSQLVPEESAQAADEVVIVLHGIRDRGPWSSRVRAALMQATPPGRRVEFSAPRFGYFSMVLFILGFRNRLISWFARAYTDVLIDFPHVQRVHFIGHSYGTYLFANALSEYTSMRFHNVYLAGSVLPAEFPWDQMRRQGRIRDLCNAVADFDYVVAIFPAALARVREIFQVRGVSRRVGDAGFVGFACAGQHEIVAIRGDHGAFLKPQYLPVGAAFVLEGPNPAFHQWIEHARGVNDIVAVPGWLRNLNRIPFVAWLALGLLVVGICLGVGEAAVALSGGDEGLREPGRFWAAVAVFVALLLL